MPALNAPVTLVGIISTVLVNRDECVNTLWDPDWQSLVDDGFMRVYDPPIACVNSRPGLGDGAAGMFLASQISDASASGIAVLTGDAATARGAIGAISQAAVTVTVGHDEGVTYRTSDYPTHDGAVQAALDSLPVGGAVLIKAGTYDFESEVSVPVTGIRIYGEGQGTILRWKSGGTFTGAYLIRTKSYCQITDLRLNGNRANTSGGNAIYVFESARVWLNRLYLQDFNESAIVGEGTSSSASSHANVYSDIKVMNCGGYAYWGKPFTYDCQITNFWAGTCGTGMRLQSGANSVTNLHLWNMTGNALEVTWQQNRFVNCYLEHSVRGAYVTEDRNTFIGCFVWANTVAGLEALDADNTIVTASSFKENVGPGILLSGSSARTVLSGNHFFDDQVVKTQTYAVSVTGTASSAVIIGNIMRVEDHLLGALNLAGGGGHETRDNVGYYNERVLLSAPTFAAQLGSPVLRSFSGTEIWDMAAASNIVAAATTIPAAWSGFDVYLLWMPLTTGTGDVAWSVDVGFNSVGQVLNDSTALNPDSGVVVQAASGVQRQLQRIQVLSAVAPLDSGNRYLRVVARRETTGNTYADNAGLVGVEFVRVS